MQNNLKEILKKNLILQKLRYQLKKNFLKSSFTFTKNKLDKFNLLIHDGKYDDAYNYYFKLFIKKRRYSFNNFNKYLSLSMRLRKKEKKETYEHIYTFNCWSTEMYVFLLNNLDKYELNRWLDLVLKNDLKFLKFIKKIDFYSRNQKLFVSKYLNSNLSEIYVFIKKIIGAMYFNDMQSNQLYSFSILENVVHERYINTKSKKKLSKCAIINLDPWTQSIGHFYYIDSFIKGVILGILDYDEIKFSENPRSIISNYYLYKKYDGFLKKTFKLNKKKYFYSYPNMDAWRLKNQKYSLAHELSYKIQKKWMDQKREPIVQFSKSEEEDGKLVINKFLEKQKWFATLHIRDSGYRYRDNLWLDTSRNSDIRNYKKAISYIYKNQGLSIRLGEKKKNLLKFRGFFDYGSSKYKSEFLDIYLISKSKFNIGTCSGISYLPIIFNKNRNILTNMSIPFFINNPGLIGVPKFFKSTINKKYQKLSLYNQFNPPLLFYGNKNLKSYNLTIEENHPEDILLAVKELNENFNNKNWLNSIKKRRTFVTKKSKNLYCNNRIPLPKMFINKYKNLLN